MVRDNIRRRRWARWAVFARRAAAGGAAEEMVDLDTATTTTPLAVPTTQAEEPQPLPHLQVRSPGEAFLLLPIQAAAEVQGYETLL